MASGKRFRKGKAKATEAPQPEPTPIFNYKDGKFLWFKERERLSYFKTKFEKREILQPRFLPLGNLENLNSLPLLSHLDNCHLTPFVSRPLSFISSPLIRAFYANIDFHEGSTTLTSSMNGKEILLSEEILNSITFLPCDGGDINQYTGTEENPFNEILFLNEMGLTNFVPTQRRRPSITRTMNPMYRTLLYLITRIIKPRKYSHTTLTKEDTRLMHAIINDAPINWCSFVLNHMADAAYEEDKPLPYAPLIMHILEHFGVNMDEAPKTNATQLWQVSVGSFKVHEEGEIPRRQQQTVQQEPLVQQVDFNSIMEKLNEMQLGINEKFNTMDARFTSMETHMDERFNSLESYMFGYFDNVGYTGYKEGFGQSSQRQDQDVGMDEEEEDDEDDEDDEETPSKSF